MARRLTGHCHCKAVTYEIVLQENEEYRECPEYDFCNDCRRVSGSLMTGWLFIYQYQLNWLTGHDKLTLYRSSKDVERLFCSICGCQFTYKNLKRDETSTAQGKNETIDIALGTLDEDILRSDESVVPMRYAWYSDILEWMKAILPSEDKVTSVTSK